MRNAPLMNIVVATRREAKAWSSGRSGSAHPDERCENRAEPRRHVLIILLAGMVWPGFPHRTGQAADGWAAVFLDRLLQLGQPF